MPEASKNIWAPWRMEYIDQLDGDEGCFLCSYATRPDDDASNRVVWRTDRVLVVMNRFPYTGGHLLVAPLEHVPDFEDMSDELLCALTIGVRDAQRVVKAALRAEGFNIGLNLGRCAGAGLPGHLHWHVVPRWGGDTNFMSVIGDVRVIPEALDRTYKRLCAAAEGVGLR
ncbi:MAG: HIT domain-containing protein [Planctomycetota bacterium]|nr:MAG: HIT domain-containing protein [Planctomycetota bacterium]